THWFIPMVQLVLATSAYRHSSFTSTWQSIVLQPADSPALDSEYPSSPYTLNTGPEALILADRPTEELLKTDVNYPGDSFDEYQRRDVFRTYFMYLPPSSDSIWVPLIAVDWNWNGDAM